jgi:hypothetical protein
MFTVVNAYKCRVCGGLLEQTGFEPDYHICHKNKVAVNSASANSQSDAIALLVDCQDALCSGGLSSKEHSDLMDRINAVVAQKHT